MSWLASDRARKPWIANEPCDKCNGGGASVVVDSESRPRRGAASAGGDDDGGLPYQRFDVERSAEQQMPTQAPFYSGEGVPPTTGGGLSQRVAALPDRQPWGGPVPHYMCPSVARVVAHRDSDRPRAAADGRLTKNRWLPGEPSSSPRARRPRRETRPWHGTDEDATLATKR